MLEPQQVLHNRYRLQKRLGRTAASRQTWLALDLEDNENPVVVKLLAFNPQLELEELKLFEREAQVLQSLDHPRIPKYRDSFSVEAQVLWFGLVQDYIPGASLQDWLDRGEVFTEDEVRQLAVNVLHILNYLHRQEPPVLHRDIKPSNLILGQDDYIYLVDFGAVQDKAALTGVTFTVVGTCGYAPLEQFWGRAVPASDLYALGATLIHLLTGVPPADLPQRNGRLQFADALQLKPFFAAWLGLLIEPAVDHRFASAEVALEAMRTGCLPLVREASYRRIQRPERSDIQVTRNTSTLEIKIPPRIRWSLNPLHSLSQATNLGCAGVLLILTSTSLLFSSLGMLVWSVPILAGALAWFFWWLLYVRESTWVIVEGDRLEIRRQSLGFTWGHLDLSLNSILGVIWQRVGLRNGVSLRTEREFINLRQGMTELECLWLVQELQDWLDHSS